MAEIRGLTLDAFEDIVQRVSAQRYGGNVTVDQSAHPLSRNGFRAWVRVDSSRDAGARRSSSGRRGRGACWHAMRDVYAEVFREYPQARIVTGLARYNGVNGFLDGFPQTADINIGSQMQPSYMPDLCDCPQWIRDADVNLTRSSQPMPVTRTRAKGRRTLPTLPARAPQPYLLACCTSTIGPECEHVRERERSDRLSIVDDIDRVLAEVAADGWTNPYTDAESPARRLAS